MEENYNKEKTQRKNDSKVIKKKLLLYKPYFNFPLQKGYKGFWPQVNPYTWIIHQYNTDF